MIRALTVLAALITFAAAVAAGVLLGIVLAPPLPSGVTLDMPEVKVVRDAPRPIGAAITVDGIDVAAAAAVTVDSIAVREAGTLEAWRLDTAESGVVSHISIAGPQPLPLDARPLTDHDILLAVGWVGEPLLGVPFRRVVFSLCDRVVGAAEAGEERPDVTRHVHPNLTTPGWSARLAVAHLPRCDAPVLRAWAAHSGGILYPLEGAWPLTFAPREDGAPAPDSLIGRAPLTPDALPPFDRRTLDVTTPRGALLRSCAAVTCETVGGVAQGSHAAMILDDADPDWVLLVADGQAGWLSRSLFTEAGQETPRRTCDAEDDECGPAVGQPAAGSDSDVGR